MWGRRARTEARTSLRLENCDAAASSTYRSFLASASTAAYSESLNVQQAIDVIAEMASAPINATVQLPPSLSDVADTARKLDFGSVLARLDGIMKVADLAAEVCRCYSATLERLN